MPENSLPRIHEGRGMECRGMGGGGECEEKRLTMWWLGIMKRLFINTCFEWRENAEGVGGLF
jgi:hypothetical protein